MQFWSAEVKADKSTPFVPPPEAQSRLHVSQATLVPGGAPEGARVAVKCTVDAKDTFLCILREGGIESTNLDLVFDAYTEFQLAGPKGARVHLSGYLMQEHDHGSEDEEDEDEDEEMAVPEGLQGMDPRQLRRLLASHGMQLTGDSDSDEEDEDDSDESSEEDDEDEQPAGRKSSVIIEDITDGPQVTGRKIPIEGPESAAAKPEPAAKPAAKATAAAAAAVKAAAAAEKAAAEAEQEESEDEEDEDEEDSEEEEEEPAKPAAAEPKRKAAATPQPTSKKAKTEAPAKQPAAAAKEAKKGAAKAEAAPATPAAQQNGTPAAGKKSVRKFPNGFVIETLALGAPSGKLAKPGKRAVMRYVGKLASNGKVFDSTRGSKTFAFRLGVGEVIKGWDQGVAGMRVGDKRRLTVPPQMAYGAEGIKGVIPGNATLTFDVELVDVKG